MMGTFSTRSTTSMSSHLYPPKLQLKLYQTFIFSVPVLFSIILILLFYLFYLKRRRRNSNLVSSQLPSIIPITNLNQTISPLVSMVDLKEEFKGKLHTIIFDEDLKAKDPQCCVCLGEFEIKEQLHQIPECKHVFHVECIHNWLQTNTTCPLCRCFIVLSITRPKHDLESATTSTVQHLTTNPPSRDEQLRESRNNSDEHISISVNVSGAS